MKLLIGWSQVVTLLTRYKLERSRNATPLVSAKAWCLPTLGDGAFQLAAPKLWNSHPAEIRNIQTLFFYYFLLFSLHSLSKYI